MDRIPRFILPALSIAPVESDYRENPSKGSGIATVDTGQTFLGNISQAGTSNERVSAAVLKKRKTGKCRYGGTQKSKRMKIDAVGQEKYNEIKKQSTDSYAKDNPLDKSYALNSYHKCITSVTN